MFNFQFKTVVLNIITIKTSSGRRVNNLCYLFSAVLALLAPFSDTDAAGTDGFKTTVGFRPSVAGLFIAHLTLFSSI